LEELKKLYEELRAIPDEEVEAREKLWIKILKKHRESLNEKQKKIDTLIKDRVGDLAELALDLNALKENLKKQVNEKKKSDENSL